jgi:hypothetical protein
MTTPLAIMAGFIALVVVLLFVRGALILAGRADDRATPPSNDHPEDHTLQSMAERPRFGSGVDHHDGADR